MKKSFSICNILAVCVSFSIFIGANSFAAKQLTQEDAKRVCRGDMTSPELEEFMTHSLEFAGTYKEVIKKCTDEDIAEFHVKVSNLPNEIASILVEIKAKLNKKELGLTHDEIIKVKVSSTTVIVLSVGAAVVSFANESVAIGMARSIQQLDIIDRASQGRRFIQRGGVVVASLAFGVTVIFNMADETLSVNRRDAEKLAIILEYKRNEIPKKQLVLTWIEELRAK